MRVKETTALHQLRLCQRWCRTSRRARLQLGHTARSQRRRKPPRLGRLRSVELNERAVRAGRAGPPLERIVRALAKVRAPRVRAGEGRARRADAARDESNGCLAIRFVGLRCGRVRRRHGRPPGRGHPAGDTGRGRRARPHTGSGGDERLGHPVREVVHDIRRLGHERAHLEVPVAPVFVQHEAHPVVCALARKPVALTPQLPPGTVVVRRGHAQALAEARGLAREELVELLLPGTLCLADAASEDDGVVNEGLCVHSANSEIGRR
jgi:hypothetical protein